MLYDIIYFRFKQSYIFSVSLNQMYALYTHFPSMSMGNI